MSLDTPDATSLTISGSNLGSVLRDLLFADHLKPGDPVSYQTAKALYLYHPLGAKIAETPTKLAQTQERELGVDVGPSERLIEAFKEEWDQLQASRNILNLMTQARVYGLTSIGMGEEGKEPDAPVDLWKLYKAKLFFNVFDPLNTSGLIVDQDPNSPTFQKHGDLKVMGKLWNRARTLTVMNEESIYIAWTDTAFAYAGRSVYQRCLYQLQSFLWSMITDRLVVRK